MGWLLVLGLNESLVECATMCVKSVVNKVLLINVNNKKCAPKIIFSDENLFFKNSDIFLHRKLTLKVRILPFLTTFVQLSL